MARTERSGRPSALCITAAVSAVLLLSLALLYSTATRDAALSSNLLQSLSSSCGDKPRNVLPAVSTVPSASLNSVAGQYALISDLQRRGCRSPSSSAWYIAAYVHDGGLGAQLVMACFHIAEALRSNRSFAFRTPVIYAKHTCPAEDWSCFFDAPVSDTQCDVPAPPAPGASDTPSDPRVTVITGWPPVGNSFRRPHVGDVFIHSAALRYLFRPNERLSSHINHVVYPQLENYTVPQVAATAAQTWTRDSRECIAVHIRGGDKTVELRGTGRESHTIDEYAQHVLRAIRSFAITDVLLLSDQPDAYAELPALVNVDDVTGVHGPVAVRSLPEAWFGRAGDQNARLTLLPDEGLHLLAMWYAMSRCKVIVGSYTSNIGRVLYEMALWWTPEGALPTFVDVNGDSWFMGAWRSNLAKKEG